MFGLVKKRLKDFEFRNKEELTKRIAQAFFNLELRNFKAFYRKVLDNILQFWLYIDRKEYVEQEGENIDPQN